MRSTPWRQTVHQAFCESAHPCTIWCNLAHKQRALAAYEYFVDSSVPSIRTKYKHPNSCHGACPAHNLAGSNPCRNCWVSRRIRLHKRMQPKTGDFCVCGSRRSRYALDPRLSCNADSGLQTRDAVATSANEYALVPPRMFAAEAALALDRAAPDHLVPSYRLGYTASAYTMAAY